MTTIRQASTDDAERLSIFLTQLDLESDYLLYDQHERNTDINVTQRYLERIGNNEKSAIFIAINEGGDIIGFIAGETPSLQRTAHTMKIVVGALKNHRGTGLGRELSHAMLQHAINVNIVRLEAGVIDQNKLSLNLCKRMGMQVEGIKRKAMKIGDVYCDEYLLAMILTPHDTLPTPYRSTQPQEAFLLARDTR